MISYKTEMTVHVTPFSDDFGMMPEVPVFHPAVAYDCPITGNSTIIIINNVLYIKEMENNLLPPIFMRLNVLMVDECPKLLCPNTTIKTHSIFFPTKNTQSPLSLHGKTSYISTRRPKGMSEVNKQINLVLPSENPYLDPSSPIYAQQESDMTNWKGEIRTILRTLTDSELASDTENTKRDVFTKAINEKLGPTLYDIGIKD